jgi:hypothetical protein
MYLLPVSISISSVNSLAAISLKGRWSSDGIMLNPKVRPSHDLFYLEFLTFLFFIYEQYFEKLRS